MFKTMGFGLVAAAVLSAPAFAQVTAGRVTEAGAIQRMARVTAFKLSPVSFTLNNKPDFDLRPKIAQNNLQVKNQGNRNTCSVFAITFLLEYLFATQKGFGIATDFSEEYLNTMKNVACNIKKDGGFFSQIAKGYAMYGIYMSGLVPYKPAYDPNYKVPSEYVQVAMKWDRAKAHFIKEWNPNMGASPIQIDQACAYLSKNIPVAGGFLWPNSLQFETKGGLTVMKTPTSKNQVFDGHSVALVGFKKSNLFPGGGYFIVRNSWGKGWGEDGYAYMTFDYVKKYANDLFAYKF